MPHAMKKPYIHSDTGQLSLPQAGQSRRHFAHRVELRCQRAAYLRQLPDVDLRPVLIVLAAVPQIVAHGDEVAAGAADGQQLAGDLPPGAGVGRPVGEHALGQAGGDAVEQHRAVPADLRQTAGQVEAPLHGDEAHACPIRHMAADTGAILVVVGRHGGPVIPGCVPGQRCGQTLGQRALAALAAADQ